LQSEVTLVQKALFSKEGNQAALEVLKERLWGDLQDQDTISTHFSSLRSLLQASFQLNLVFTIKGRYRSSQGFEGWVEPKSVHFSSHLSEHEVFLVASPQSLLQKVMQSFTEGAIREMGLRLREADPRIGTRVFVGQMPDPPFPRCPLLDPPVFSLPGILGESPFVRCTLCGERFRISQEVYWGGGDLLWGCAPCACRGEQGSRETVDGLFRDEGIL